MPKSKQTQTYETFIYVWVKLTIPFCVFSSVLESQAIKEKKEWHLRIESILSKVMVTTNAKRRVKLRIEKVKFQNLTKTKTKTKQKHWQKHGKNKKQTMTKRWLFQFFLTP